MSPYMVKRTLQFWLNLGSAVQFGSVAHSCLALCSLMDCSMPGFTVHQQLPELAQTHIHWVGDSIKPSHSLTSLSPPASVFSNIRVFSNESGLHIRCWWSKYWSFSFNISPFNDHSGLTSFRMDWFNLLSVQETLKHFSSTSWRKHQSFGTHLSSQSKSHIHTWPQEKP